jgi:hypothetical protein
MDETKHSPDCICAWCEVERQGTMTTSHIASEIGDDPCSNCGSYGGNIGCDVCGLPLRKRNSGDALLAPQGFCFATIRRHKYPSEYMGWSVEQDSPRWTSDRLSAAPVPLEILMSELNKVSAREPNAWAVVFPTNNRQP